MTIVLTPTGKLTQGAPHAGVAASGDRSCPTVSRLVTLRLIHVGTAARGPVRRRSKTPSDHEVHAFVEVAELGQYCRSLFESLLCYWRNSLFDGGTVTRIIGGPEHVPMVIILTARDLVWSDIGTRRLVLSCLC